MTNRLEWDLVDGVSEYHILKYDNPNFNEATYDNHIITKVTDNHYDIDENDNGYYLIAYEKDNIIKISNPIINTISDNGLVCDITVNVDASRSRPVVYLGYPINEHITENTAKSTFNFDAQYNNNALNFIVHEDRDFLCRFTSTNGKPAYVEYTNDKAFGTDDFVIEFGIASWNNQGNHITLCTIGNIQLLLRIENNDIGFYYNQSRIGYGNYYNSNSDGYSKVKIERVNGVFKFYHNDFFVYQFTDKKSDKIDDKFYIGGKNRNDYQIAFSIIDYVKINGKNVEPTNIVGDNWQYTRGCVLGFNNDRNKFVIRPKEFLTNDFTIIADVNLQKLNGGSNIRTFVDLNRLGLELNHNLGKITALNADKVYNEYNFVPTIENRPVKVALVRKKGICYIFINQLLICSIRIENTIDDINCVFSHFIFTRVQVFDNANFYNVDVGTTIHQLPNNAIRFTSVILNDNGTVSLEWNNVNRQTVKIFRDGSEIGTSTENNFIDNTVIPNKSYVYRLETDNYISQEHIVYTHKYNPFYNAIGMELYNNDGYIWDFRSCNTYLQDNDKTKQKQLYTLSPFYENKKGFGLIGGGQIDSMFNHSNGSYHFKPSEPLTDFTFEVTINPNKFFGRDNVLLQIIGVENFKFYEIYLNINSSRQLFLKVLDQRNGTNQTIIQTNNQLNINTWYNIVLTRNGNNYSLYLDGNRIGNSNTNANLGIVDVFVGSSCNYRYNCNAIFDFISLTKNVAYNGNYTISKTLPQVTNNHLLYIDFENGWQDKSNHNQKNLRYGASYITTAEYKDNWFTTFDRNEIGWFYYHWEQIPFHNKSAMIEFDYIAIDESNFFRTFLSHSAGVSLVSNGGGLLRYFNNYNRYRTRENEHINLTNSRIKATVLIENVNTDVSYATLYINGVAVKSVPHYVNGLNYMFHNVGLWDNGNAGYVSNMRVYTNILPLLEHDVTKNIGFTYNSKVIDYRCAINKTSITIDDTNPNNVYDVFDDLGNKILDGVKKGTHNCTIEREKYKIIERNSELSFDKWIELDDEHWDNVVFYHKFGNENDEKFNHPMQSRYPLIFENGTLLCRHAVIHTRSVDFGTSDFTIEIEFKSTDYYNMNGAFLTFNCMYESAVHGNFVLDYNGGLYLADYNGAVSGSWNISANVGQNNLMSREWRTVVIMRKNGVLTYTVDGEEVWRTNSTHNIRPHHSRNIVLGYDMNNSPILFRKLRITKSARF